MSLLQECFPSVPEFRERDWWNEIPLWRVKLHGRGWYEEEDQDRLVAYCSGISRVMFLRHPDPKWDAALPMLLVGQVATTASFRRRGYARAAIEALHALARRDHDYAILTTNSPWVYEPLGYVRIEKQLPFGMVAPLRASLDRWPRDRTLDVNGAPW